MGQELTFSDQIRGHKNRVIQFGRYMAVSRNDYEELAVTLAVTFNGD